VCQLADESWQLLDLPAAELETGDPASAAWTNVSASKADSSPRCGEKEEQACAALVEASPAAAHALQVCSLLLHGFHLNPFLNMCTLH
jgi:hypothetical protein